MFFHNLIGDNDMATYNGHKSWTHWNVSLWINNDEGLYRTAVALARTHGKDTAAHIMMAIFDEQGVTHTPDGAKYSKAAIRAALVGM